MGGGHHLDSLANACTNQSNGLVTAKLPTATPPMLLCASAQTIHMKAVLMGEEIVVAINYIIMIFIISL